MEELGLSWLARSQVGQVSLIDDQFDVDLVDHALLEEVVLTAVLIVAASQSEAPLSLAEIDRILGVTLAPVIPRPRSAKEHDS